MCLYHKQVFVVLVIRILVECIFMGLIKMFFYSAVLLFWFSFVFVRHHHLRHHHRLYLDWLWRVTQSLQSHIEIPISRQFHSDKTLFSQTIYHDPLDLSGLVLCFMFCSTLLFYCSLWLCGISLDLFSVMHVTAGCCDMWERILVIPVDDSVHFILRFYYLTPRD